MRSKPAMLLVVVIPAVLTAALLVGAALVGCGGASGPINLGDGFNIDPPINPQATTPSATKFGPVAGYLPPAGTTLNYQLSSILVGDGPGQPMGVRLRFATYDNTGGSVTVDRWLLDGTTPTKHKRHIVWFKNTSGRSYIWKMKVVRDKPSPMPDDVVVLSPGMLVGHFSSTPAKVRSTWTKTLNGVPEGVTYAIYQQFLGTRSVVSGGTTYNCKVSRCTFDLAHIPEIAGLDVYWAPGVGAVYGDVSAIGSLMTAGSRDRQPPKWARLLDLRLVAVQSDQP